MRTLAVQSLTSLMTTMNLTTDPWIPAITADGRQRDCSLLELFASAHELRDLAAMPHEKVSLLRLLICITQAALDGPAHHEAWEDCREAIPLKVAAYLQKWKGSFELFGDGPRFLQVPGLKPGKEDSEGNPATKIDLALASGNNASLFDNSAGLPRKVSAGRLALTLVSFQCFAPGGRIGVAKWNGVDTPAKGSSNHAPCIPSGMLHAFLQGKNLLTTIHLNLLNKEEASDLGAGGWGRPVWEMPVDSITNDTAILNATTSYLGRLVPISRAIRLHPEGVEIVLANGIDYPLYPVFREPAATVVERKDGPGILGVSLGRSVWRQLPAITVKRRASKDALCGPLALPNLGDDHGCALWIAALATDKAKIEDVVEASYDIPAGMFRDSGRKLYEEGIDLAEQWQLAMWKGIKAYAASLKLEPPPYDRGRQHFWTTVEQHVPKLLSLAGSPESAGDLKTSLWGKALKEAAVAAYEHACPHQTPRQIEAFALGRQQLFLPKPKDDSASASQPSKSKKNA
jgi:CRISPR system Cascade subunit CasA